MCIIYVLPNCQNSQFCGANFQLRAGKICSYWEKNSWRKSNMISKILFYFVNPQYENDLTQYKIQDI